MTGRLQARIDSNQEKIESEIKGNNEKFEVLRSTLVTLMDIHQVWKEAIQEEIIAKMDTHQERMGSQCECLAKTTMACQGAPEACLKGKAPASVEIESIAVHEVVPKEACSENFQSTEGALWGPAFSHMTPPTGKDSAARATQVGWTFGKRRQPQLKCNNTIRN
jgi:hypothetical protein